MYEDKKEKQAPLILQFLINKLEKNEKEFTSLELKTYDPRLINSGDRILRYLAEYHVIKYDLISQPKGLYKLKSDIFDLQAALNDYEETGIMFKPFHNRAEYWLSGQLELI